VRIKVLTYGMVRDLLARDEFDLELPAGTTVLAAVTQIAAAAGAGAERLILSPDRRRIKVIARVDGQVAGPDTPLHDGAELKLIHGQH
jgi:molybdopterin converting factor small subunit